MKPIEDPIRLLKAIAKILDDRNIQYFVTGGFAVSVWGRPRFTADIDLVVTIDELAVPVLVKELKKLSSSVYIDIDQMKDALERKSEFNFIEANAGIKVDFWILDSDIDRQAMDRRQYKIIQRQKIAFISPEDLIISKLKWYDMGRSDRHLEDIQSVIAVTKNFDWQYIKKWARKLGLTDELKKII